MTDNFQQPQEPTPQQEPSVLDYLKSLFRFGGSERIQLPEFGEEQQVALSDQPSEVQPETFQPSNIQAPLPWRSLLALMLALLGQRLFEPPPTTIPLGVAFYMMALSALGWAIYRGEWKLAPLAETSDDTDSLTYRRLALLISLPLAFWAFI